MDLTDYEKQIFANIEEIKNGELVIKFDTWYLIDPNRPDHAEFITALKKYIETWGNIEFNGNYTKFRRCPRWNAVDLLVPKKEIDRGWYAQFSP